MTLSLLSYNIRFGGAERQALIAEVIRAVSPDLVVFQEATDPTVIAGLARATGLRLWGAQPGHSTGFISRVPVTHYTWHRAAGARHAFLELVLGDDRSRVFGLHLSARFSKWDERRRAREIRALLHGIEEHQHGFHVLVGDFNTLAPGERLETARMPGWIRGLIWLSGRDLARETIQVMLDAEYDDAFRALHPGEAGYTFPTWDPHVRLDYLFTPARFTSRVTACEVVTEPATAATASDHFPLLARLELGEG